MSTRASAIPQKKQKNTFQTTAPPENNTDIGEIVGGFHGYLRRTSSNKNGMIAQIFGENGQDSDFISALHLSSYLDATLKVSIWMIKDKDGRIMDDGEGRSPLLTEFIAINRRPKSSNSGSTAQFFGENGPNADAINVLNKSDLQDSLVFVELQRAVAGMLAGDIPTEHPAEQLDEGKERLTHKQQEELKKLQKRSEQAHALLLQSGFFAKPEVLTALGKSSSFKDWVTTQPCVHPGGEPCQNGPCVLFEVASQVISKRLGNFTVIPFCIQHEAMWKENLVTEILDPERFLSNQAMLMAQRWAQQRIREDMNVPAGILPSPNLIYAWALDRKLQMLLPPTMIALIE